MKKSEKSGLVAYYRVSTSGQGKSGLGLSAQKGAVRKFAKSQTLEVVAEFEEVESGKLKERPQLMRALAYCKKHGHTLVIARLDRLARNLFVVASLLESKVEFIAADMPTANKLTIQLMAAIAEAECDRIRHTTKESLKIAKENGKVLGNPNIGEAREIANKVRQGNADKFAMQMFPMIEEQMKMGRNYTQIADFFNRTNVKTVRGKDWTVQAVKNAYKRGHSLNYFNLESL